MAESLNDRGKQDLTSLYLIFDQFICNIYCSVFPLDVFFNWRVSECTFINPEWKSKSLQRSATFPERLDIKTCTVHIAQKVIMEVLPYGIL